MMDRQAVRWLVTPIAALSGLLGAYLFLAVCSLLLQRVVPAATLDTIVRADVREGLVGIVTALITVLAGCAVAPAAQRIVAAVLFSAGGWLAWIGLRHWYFPESSPLAYQESLVPLAMTYLGGLAAVGWVWWRSSGREGRPGGKVLSDSAV